MNVNAIASGHIVTDNTHVLPDHAANPLRQAAETYRACGFLGSA